MTKSIECSCGKKSQIPLNARIRELNSGKFWVVWECECNSSVSLILTEFKPKIETPVEDILKDILYNIVENEIEEDAEENDIKYKYDSDDVLKTVTDLLEYGLAEKIRELTQGKFPVLDKYDYADIEGDELRK
jgi:hypothetical protein